MSKKILAFGAKKSINSINKKLAIYTANQIKDAEVPVLDLNDFEMPIYSIDRSKEHGILGETLSNEFYMQLNQFSASWIEQ